MCFLSDFSIEKQLSQTLKVKAVDQAILVALRLVEWFRELCKEVVEADRLRAVS